MWLAEVRLQRLVAFAPDLFASAPNLPEDRQNVDAMRDVWQSIPDAQLIEDLQAVYRQAAKHPDVMADKVGVVGFCMGGAIALMFAASTQQIAWIADFYGRVFYPELNDKRTKHPVDYVVNLKCPVIGLFAGRDELISAADIEELRAHLEQSRQKFELKVYPETKHAFFNNDREFYDAKAAKDAWQSMLDFVGRSIRLPGAR